jgi:hypothetical protein
MEIYEHPRTSIQLCILILSILGFVKRGYPGLYTTSTRECKLLSNSRVLSFVNTITAHRLFLKSCFISLVLGRSPLISRLFLMVSYQIFSVQYLRHNTLQAPQELVSVRSLTMTVLILNLFDVQLQAKRFRRLTRSLHSKCLAVVAKFLTAKYGP